MAYRYANKEVKIIEEKLYITYIDIESKTNLKVGDELLEINDQVIIDRTQINNIIQNTEIGTKIYFKVKRNDKIIDCYAEPIILEEKKDDWYNNK